MPALRGSCARRSRAGGSPSRSRFATGTRAPPGRRCFAPWPSWTSWTRGSSKSSDPTPGRTCWEVGGRWARWWPSSISPADRKEASPHSFALVARTVCKCLTNVVGFEGHERAQGRKLHQGPPYEREALAPEDGGAGRGLHPVSLPGRAGTPEAERGHPPG